MYTTSLVQRIDEKWSAVFSPKNKGIENSDIPRLTHQKVKQNF